MKQNPRKTLKHYSARIREAEYKRQVKLMRPYFGDTFRPSEGFDLRDFENWTGAQKRKLTKYWRVVAGQVSQDHQARFYRREDHLMAAIGYTQQTEPLPGQRAAIYTIPKAAQLDVSFTETGRIRVKREGREVLKVFFDQAALAFDPEAEAERALERLPEHARLRLMVGVHEGRRTFNADEAQLEVNRITVGGGSDRGRKFLTREGLPHWADWLHGFVAYERRFKKKRQSRARRAMVRARMKE